MDERTLARLKNGGIDAFVDLLLNDLLDRPVVELVDPDWLAARLAEATRSAAADPQVESWFRDRVTDARRRVPQGRPQVPPEILDPLRALLARPYVPDRALVGRLLDHEAVRLLLRSLFQDLLIGFVKKLKAPLPAAARSPLNLGGLKRFGEGVLGAVGHELEAQVDGKAREFMDAGIGRLVDQLADHLCDPQRTRDFGDWRAHGVDVLLGTDMKVLAGEVEKLDPESLVATGAALVRGIANRPELPTELAAIIRAATEATEGRTARSLLGGLEQHGIDAVRDVLVQRGRAVVETRAFAAWWDTIHAD